MIIDPPPALDDDDQLDDNIDADLDWDNDGHLDGLRRAGLPVTTRRAMPAVGERYTTVDVLDAALASSTRAAYQASWARFMIWSDIRNLGDPTRVEPLDVANWITRGVNAGHTPSYLRRELAGVRHHLTRHGISDPPTDHPGVKQALAGAARIRGEAQRRAIPLALDDMRRLVTGLAITTNRDLTHPAVRRDRALIGLGWAIAQRGTNLVGLDVDDLAFTDDGLLVTIRKSKTDQTGRGHTIAVPWSHQQATCPVRAAMILTRDRYTGPMFVNIDRHQHTHHRLTVEGITKILRRHITNVLQRDPAGYTSHSLRAGFVTEARHRGVPDAVIMRRTGHTTAHSLQRYDRPQDLLHDAQHHLGDWW